MAQIAVKINGINQTLPQAISVRQAIEQFGPSYGHAAAWINGVSILLRDYDSRLLAPGDDMKIIRISGGG